MQQLPRTDTGGLIDGCAVLRAIEADHSIFVQRGEDARGEQLYTFAHLSFQEYFTAKYIAENHTEAALPKEYLADRRWREVMLMTVSLLANADNFFDHFLKALAAMIANDPALVEILQWANGKAAGVPYKPAAGRAFYIFLARARALALAERSEKNLDSDSPPPLLWWT